MKINYIINRITKRTLLLLSLVVLVSSQSFAQISVVVSSSSAHKATDSEIKNIYTGNLFTWSDGSKVAVVDQADSPVGSEFYSKFIGETASKLRLRWTKLVLSGQTSAPVKSDGDAAVKKAVASDNNAVGYILSSSLDGTVKEIFRVEK